MKKCIFLVMFFCLAAAAYPYEYIMNSNPSGVGYYSGSTQITALTGGDWDSGHYDLALPAINQFYFYGEKVTHLRICTNGYVCLGFGSASGADSYLHQAIPIPTGVNNFVAPLMQDYMLAGGTGGAGAMYYTVNTSTGYVIVEWRGVRVDGSASADYTFSVVFCGHGHTNLPDCIVLSYSDVDAGDAAYDFGADASVGIENATGTLGERFSDREAIVSNSTRILFTPFVPVYGSTIDAYAGTNDGYPDAVVFRPSNGMWYYKNSDGSTASWGWGQKGDIALPADYDGDGDGDELVFRPGNSTWYCSAPFLSKIWGQMGDVPVPGDYNGDGVWDIGIFRPRNGIWSIYYMGSGPSMSVMWGTTGDIAVPGDYDNDGKTDLAVFRPANNMWYIRKSSDLATISKAWGQAGDIPMAANFHSDTYSTITVYRPSTGFYHAYDQLGTYSSYNVQWGQDGDVPVPCDQNSGGLTDETVFRPATNASWFLKYHNYLPASFIWGTLGDKPRLRRGDSLITSPPPSKRDH